MSLCMAEGGVTPRGPAQFLQLFQLDVWLVCRLPPPPAQLLLAPPHTLHCISLLPASGPVLKTSPDKGGG